MPAGAPREAEARVTIHRRCTAADSDVENCKLDCLQLEVCGSMSHDGACCFLYEASSCTQSAHATAGQYSTYFKTAPPGNAAGRSG